MKSRYLVILGMGRCILPAYRVSLIESDIAHLHTGRHWEASKRESKHGFSPCFVHCFKHKPPKGTMRAWHASVTLGLFQDKDCFLFKVWE